LVPPIYMLKNGPIVNTIRYVLHSFSEVSENMTCVSMPLKTEKQEWGLVHREILRPLYACMYVRTHVYVINLTPIEAFQCAITSSTTLTFNLN
jgi:hypothetical protein